MTEKNRNTQDSLEQAVIIHKKFAFIRDLLEDPKNNELVVKSIHEGKTDVEIAQLLNVGDTKKVAAAIGTYRWKTGELPARPPEVDAENRKRAGAKWVEENPDRRREIQAQAAAAAAEKTTGVPVKYTPEIQEKIRQALEGGTTYQQVADMLTASGDLEDATASQIRHAANLWGIQSTFRGESQARQQAMEEEIIATARQCSSRKEVRDLLPQYTKEQIAKALSKYGIRLEHFFDWDSTVDGLPIREVAYRNYIEQKRSIKKGFVVFNQIMEQHGIEPVGIDAYKSVIGRKNRELRSS